MEQTVYFNGLTDKLTGFRLHANFETDLGNLLIKADNTAENVSLVILDIDNFKNINKRYGKDAGDQALLSASERLTEFFTGGHYFYRYGGDSFAVILCGVEKENAFLFTEKARDAISRAWVRDKFSFTASAGVSTYRDDGLTAPELVRKAEGALFRAKTTGRDKVAIAREEKMVTKTSHYAAEQLQMLSLLAKETGYGEASILREALSGVLKKYDDKNRYLNGKTVIIIDDSVYARSALRDIMTQNGYRVLGDFENGKNAAEFYNGVPADFVLLDIMMPVMDGIDFLKAIQKREGSRIIAVSAVSKESVVLSAVENGADYFIVKPFQPESLLNVLSWEAEAYLKASGMDNYRSYYKGKKFGDDVMLTQAEIDAVRML